MMLTRTKLINKQIKQLSEIQIHPEKRIIKQHPPSCLMLTDKDPEKPVVVRLGRYRVAKDIDKIANGSERESDEEPHEVLVLITQLSECILKEIWKTAR